MTKRVLHVAAAVFLLVAAYQLGTTRSLAQGRASTIFAMDFGGWALDYQGRVWNVGNNGTPWDRTPALGPPIPLSEIERWGAWALVSTSGEGWWHDGSAWHSAGPFPGGPVGVAPQSFGRVKGSHR